MPKLRPEQLSAALTKQLASIYLVSGDEPLLIQECCDQIRAAARKNGFSERELYHVDTSFDWGQLLAAANSLSDVYAMGGQPFLAAGRGGGRGR